MCVVSWCVLCVGVATQASLRVLVDDCPAALILGQGLLDGLISAASIDDEVALRALSRLMLRLPLLTALRLRERSAVDAYACRGLAALLRECGGSGRAYPPSSAPLGEVLRCLATADDRGLHAAALSELLRFLGRREAARVVSDGGVAAVVVRGVRQVRPRGGGQASRKAGREGGREASGVKHVVKSCRVGGDWRGIRCFPSNSSGVGR